MADCDVVPAHDDLLPQQPYDSLTPCHFQDVASGAQSCAEIGEGCCAAIRIFQLKWDIIFSKRLVMPMRRRSWLLLPIPNRVVTRGDSYGMAAYSLDAAIIRGRQFLKADSKSYSVLLRCCLGDFLLWDNRLLRVSLGHMGTVPRDIVT